LSANSPLYCIEFLRVTIAELSTLFLAHPVVFSHIPFLINTEVIQLILRLVVNSAFHRSGVGKSSTGLSGWWG